MKDYINAKLSSLSDVFNTLLHCVLDQPSPSYVGAQSCAPESYACKPQFWKNKQLLQIIINCIQLNVVCI